MGASGIVMGYSMRQPKGINLALRWVPWIVQHILILLSLSTREPKRHAEPAALFLKLPTLFPICTDGRYRYTRRMSIIVFP